MATSIFELFGTIMVDNKEANKSLSDTDKKAGNLAKSLGNGIKTVGKFAAGVAAGATAAVGAITKMASDSAATMDVVDKASQRMKISTDAYQELTHAAELSGVEMATLEAAAKKLDGNMSFDQALNEIYALETAEERAAKAAELFGDGVAYKMTPMLNASAEDMAAMREEAHELGLVFSEETVKAGASLSDTMGNLKASFGAVKTGLGASLMPVVQKFADLLLKFLPKVQDIFDRLSPILIELFDSVMPVIFDLADALLPVIFDIMEALLPIFSEVAKTILPILVDLISKLTPIIKSIADAVLPVISKLLNAIAPILDAIWPVISGILDVVISLLEPLLKIVLSVLSPLINGLQILNPLFEVLAAVLQPVLDLINLILSPVLDFINWIFGDITSGVEDVEDSLGDENSSKGLMGALGGVSNMLFGDFGEAFGFLKDTLGKAVEVIGGAFSGIINFLKDPKQALSDFFNWASGLLSGLIDGIKSIGQAISDSKEAAERKKRTEEAVKQKESEGWHFVSSDNGKTTTVMNDEQYKKYAQDTISKLSGTSLAKSTLGKFIGLAEGAVLEPNKPFLAMVGDQKSGTNVEAPLDTIKQAVAEVLNEIDINANFSFNYDKDTLFELVKEKAWIERKRGIQTA